VGDNHSAMEGRSEAVTYTLGPWKIVGIQIFSQSGIANICELSEPRALPYIGHRALDIGSPDWDEAIANARLIAAAPDLLEACEVFIREADNPPDKQQAYELAKAAIAKAKGEHP